MVANWIYEENLRFFMEALAHVVGATFDDDDWIGLHHELILRPDEPGHLDQERQVGWPLDIIDVTLSIEPGDSAVRFQLVADAELELRADTLAYAMQRAVVRVYR